MNREQLYEFCIAEERALFEGWDFSYTRGRRDTDELPWSYKDLARQKIRENIALLDMGTGGGELLSSFAPLPERTYATESYQPNIPIAKSRLEPLGVEVREIYSDENLPFEAEMFDSIINSHESYNVHEVKRILKDSGEFLTQQVGCENLKELTEIIGTKSDPVIAPWNLEFAVGELENAGFKVTYRDEFFPLTRFYDIGAIVYHAKVNPWQFPKFSVDGYFENLCNIHSLIQKQGYYATKAHRFIICARK